MSLKKVFLVAALLVVGISSAVLYRSATLPGKTYTITLTENGFEPQKTTVRSGDTVVFRTTRKEMFWPASDLHPTHGIYPEFDPKEPINYNKEWRFTFRNAGTWKYHDHLFPFYRGTIIVTAKSSFLTFSQNSSCKKGDLSCYVSYIESVLDRKGIEAAFDTVLKLYRVDPAFAQECHSAVHELGRAAYREFVRHDKLLLSSKASFCAYGFYHGFMDELLLTNGSVSKAQEFCDRAHEQLKNTARDTGGACYHGIGHGLTDKHIPSKMGSFTAVIEPNLKICEEISKTEANLYRCATGVYNATEILASANKYGLTINETDPFSLCRAQKPQYQDDCYPQFVPPLLRIVKDDFYQASKFIEDVENDQHAKTTMVALGNEVARVKGATAEKVKSYISLCRTIQSRLHLSCITALAEGLMKYGPPSNEHQEAFVFCNLSELSEKERSACYQRIGPILPLWYDESKLKTICDSALPEYRKYCVN